MLRIFSQNTKQNLCLIFNSDIACLMNIVCFLFTFPLTNEAGKSWGEISFSFPNKYRKEIEAKNERIIKSSPYFCDLTILQIV